jgi:hypothetical protein
MASQPFPFGWCFPCLSQAKMANPKETWSRIPIDSISPALTLGVILAGRERLVVPVCWEHVYRPPTDEELAQLAAHVAQQQTEREMRQAPPVPDAPLIVPNRRIIRPGEQ